MLRSCWKRHLTKHVVGSQRYCRIASIVGLRTVCTASSTTSKEKHNKDVPVKKENEMLATESKANLKTYSDNFSFKCTTFKNSLDYSHMYDVVIVGGGVTGSSLLYLLSSFTNLKRIGLIERRDDFGTVASGALSNSQTIHCGDIETNYNINKATLVKRQADMLRNYATKLPEGQRDQCIFKMAKMVMGVGYKEMEELEERASKFKNLFPNQHLITKKQIKKIEPHVIQLTSYRDRPENMNAIYTDNEHVGVNYNTLSQSFIKSSCAATDKQIDVVTNIQVDNILSSNEESPSYTIHTSQGKIRAKFVVVAACGYSLLMAHKLGYGLNYGCLPVAGSFYFAKTPVLNGKVYTVQNPKLPFAAIHGDPDVVKQGCTRFGPTALPMMLLERDNLKSFKDFLTVSRLDFKYLWTLTKLFGDSVMIDFAVRNFLYEVPYIGRKLFAQSVRKIVPGLRNDDIYFAKGCGGIRPQLIDKESSKLLMGEGKIKGKNIVFNITPSPGGTTCLGNAEIDMRNICQTLNASILEDKLKKTLFQGAYPVLS